MYFYVQLNIMSRGKKRFHGNKTKKQKDKRIEPSDLEGKILDYLSEKSNSAVKPNQLFAKFLKHYSSEKIESALQKLEKRKAISYTDNGKIKRENYLSGDKKEIIGVADVAMSGVAYVKVEGFEKDIFIPKKHTKNVIAGDTVKVEMTSFSKSKPEGIITDIIKRSQEEFICYFEESDGFGFAVPKSGKVVFDIFIPESKKGDAKNGDLVLVQITEWHEDSKKNPVGKVIEKLTGLSDNELEMRNILIENGFNIVFPATVMNEVEAIGETISEEEIAQRLDYRDVLTMTIDPVDAKDFDDALSIKKLDNGLMQIGVHIADVSHYVKPGSEVDKEAQLRATSVYLPDRVCPMLPEKLSNMVCSLRPNEDKCTFSVLFDFNEKHDIVNYTFAKTITRSDRRFAYEEVQEILESGEGDYASELQYLNRVAFKLREKRFKNGAINFDSEEVRFELDENAVPIGVYVKMRKDANLLVEDFMLLANTTVAKYLSKLELQNESLTAVYRVHDLPDEGKLEILGTIARRFGYTFSFNDSEQVRSALNNLVDILQGKPELHILSSLAVRTMAKAEYTTKNIGHYGLAYNHYTHFTSPIRRYPDVLVHRLLLERMLKEKPHYNKMELEELCRISSMMERKAQSAEREAIKYKQVEFLLNKVGQEFDGIITGVISRGFFVEMLENKCEGFVSLSEFDETFLFEEEHLRLVGMHTKTIFQIGQKVRVLLVRADLKDKKVDLDVILSEQ
jgi:ribonuclease R